MRTVLLAAAAAAGFSGAGFAADLPVKAPPPPPPPAFVWTGCHVGVFAGGAVGARDPETTDLGRTGVANGLAGAAYNGTFDHAWTQRLNSSFIAGAGAGCDYQFVGTQVVIGLEGEAAYMHLTGSAADPLSTGADTIATGRIGDGYGMAALRAGWAFDRVLVYAKVGVAVVEARWSVADTCATAGVCSATTIATGRFGGAEAAWTAGGGIEWAFDPRWSVKAEYMYIGLDASQVGYGVAYTAAGPITTGTYQFQHDFGGIHTAKVGLNYRFGFGPAILTP